MHKVSIVECDSYAVDKVLPAVRKAIASIGFRIKPNSKVLLKPNVLMGAAPEKAITTHPAILDAVCKILKEKHCEIIIAESFAMAVANSEATFKKSGLWQVAEKHKAKIMCFSAGLLRKVHNENAVFEKEMLLPEIIFNVDLIINLPKLKTHALMVYTGAVKNLFGCIPGGTKQAYHAKAGTKENFANLLLDIFLNVKPQLSIMDGIVGMECNGPSYGTPVHSNIIMASDNAIAMDLIVERIIGFDGKVLTNSLALERGLIKREEIRTVGNIPSIKFRLPGTSFHVPQFIANFALKHLVAYPLVMHDKCTRCMTCVKVCPVGAMQKGEEGFPFCYKKLCITCYCCHEICPYGAIELRSSAIFRLIYKIYNRIMKPKKKPIC